MPRSCLVACAIFLLIAPVCAPALAAEDESPTGTIEVEVVYKDTGEPVPEPHVEVRRGSDMVYSSASAFKSAQKRYMRDIARPLVDFGEYDVVLCRLSPPAMWEWYLRPASHFVYREPGPVQRVTLSPEQPVAHVVFEVERGWVLCGTVRRQDGSPLRQALVMVEQGSSRTEWAYALSESDGTFSILGIAPAERARVRIASAVDVHSYGLPGFAELSSQEIKLEGERSNADFEVQVTSLELVVDFELPIWPSKELKEKWAPALAVWIDGNPADGPQSADLLFYCPDNMYATLVHRRDALIFRSDRYSICLEDMPPGKTITLAVGIEDLTQNDFDDPAAGCTYCTYRTTTVGRSPQPVHLRAYAPGTRESRVLAMGSAGLVVVVVCVLFLVRDARRRGKPGKP